MELELSLCQKQILSQRMQLSVKILQMNAHDLKQFIRESALENPLIELEPPEEIEDPSETRLKKLEWLDSMDDSNSYRYMLKPDRNDHNIPLFDKNTVDSLWDVLLAQLPGFHLTDEVERRVCYLIGNLDENGYIAIPRDQLLQDFDMNDAQLDEALDVLHRMEPPGVGSVDLRECLLIQARRKSNVSPVLIELIETHLDILAKNQLEKLAKILCVSIDDIKDARNQLLALNPKPGNGYSSYKEIPYIRPDLFIIRFENSLQLVFNDFNQPKIEISSYYRELAKSIDAETASYVNDKLDRAEWLVSCIRQRKSTILNCARSILRQQSRFFEHGSGNLLPMTLADVACDIKVHPSTVSRAIRGKYLQCQWGVFELSDLFSHSVSQMSETGGTNLSQDMILMQIKRIIDEEDPTNPKSDQEIAIQLQKRDIKIARRTVAKYREQMGLSPASGRKIFTSSQGCKT